jgi:hypothetical protein
MPPTRPAPPGYPAKQDGTNAENNPRIAAAATRLRPFRSAADARQASQESPAIGEILTLRVRPHQPTTD